MQPSARLVQGNFSDLDLLLADNFVRVADAVGVKQIVYVGGLLPAEAEASPHLRSRAEVAETLGSRRPKLSALRAGIIVGEGGPSLWILLNLVRRLPVMVLPSWTRSRSQPIALRDVVRAVKRCLAEPDRFEGHFDIGGPDVLSYRELDQRSNQLAHLLRAHGLARLDHYSIFMENDERYLEACRDLAAEKERQREAAGIRAAGDEEAQGIRAEADKQVTIIKANATKKSEILRGEGDAERNKVLGDAYGRDAEFFEFYRTLRAYEQSMTGDNTTMVISPDSPFFKYFRQGQSGR